MLEKILEEIDNLKNLYKKGAFALIDEGNLPCKYDKSDIESAKVQALSEAMSIIRKHMNEGKDINVSTKDNDGWIPVEDQDRLPKDDKYILLSFENFSLPMVGRYEENKEGGVFYLGDCDGEDTCISQDLYVNAWQPLPKPYRQEKGAENAKNELM